MKLKIDHKQQKHINIFTQILINYRLFRIYHYFFLPFHDLDFCMRVRLYSYEVQNLIPVLNFTFIFREFFINLP